MKFLLDENFPLSLYPNRPPQRLFDLLPSGELMAWDIRDGVRLSARDDSR